MPDQWVTIQRFQNVDQAQFFRERLEGAGIVTVVVEEEAEPSMGEGALPGPGGPILLKVREQDMKQAGTVLEEGFDEGLGGNPQVV